MYMELCKLYLYVHIYTWFVQKGDTFRREGMRASAAGSNCIIKQPTELRAAPHASFFVHFQHGIAGEVDIIH